MFYKDEEYKFGYVKDNQIVFEDNTCIDLDPSMQLKPAFEFEEGCKVKVIIVKED